MISSAPRTLLMATVYVTEAARTSTIAHLQTVLNAAITTSAAAGSAPLSHLLSFSDQKYNRTSFTVGGECAGVRQAMVQVARAAFESCPLRASLAEHEGSEHPRIGAVDHISVFPLAGPSEEASRNDAAAVAVGIGEELSSLLPVYLYGYAARMALGKERRLRDIRRELGYFGTGSSAKTSSDSTSPSSLAWLQTKGAPLPIAPDLPRAMTAPHDPSLGVTCVGAVEPVLNYNIQVAVEPESKSAGEGTDADGAGSTSWAAALVECKRIARAIGERSPDGKGLKGVEALALPYDEGRTIEIACNLLDTATTPPEAVLQRVVEELGAGTSSLRPCLRVAHHYQIGLTAAQALEKLGVTA